jgi:hypothetical protein
MSRLTSIALTSLVAAALAMVGANTAQASTVHAYGGNGGPAYMASAGANSCVGTAAHQSVYLGNNTPNSVQVTVKNGSAHQLITLGRYGYAVADVAVTSGHAYAITTSSKIGGVVAVDYRLPGVAFCASSLTGASIYPICAWEGNTYQQEVAIQGWNTAAKATTIKVKVANVSTVLNLAPYFGAQGALLVAGQSSNKVTITWGTGKAMKSVTTVMAATTCGLG